MGGVLPGWDKEACITCKLCVSICPAQAIEQREKDFVLDTEKCILCGLCIRNCPSSAWTARKTGYTLYLGGTMGKKPRLGTKAKVLIETKEELTGDIRNGPSIIMSLRAGKRSASATPSTGSGWTRHLTRYSRERKRAPPQPRKMTQRPP